MFVFKLKMKIFMQIALSYVLEVNISTIWFIIIKTFKILNKKKKNNVKYIIITFQKFNMNHNKMK